jgi:hypothetical protein
MVMTRHEGGECGKGPYHAPPCDPPEPGEMMADRTKTAFVLTHALQIARTVEEVDRETTGAAGSE